MDGVINHTRKGSARREQGNVRGTTKIRLAELEEQIVRELTKAGATRDANDLAERMAAIGDPIVNEGGLEFYTAQRYGDGRWVSAAVLKRVRAQLPESAQQAPAKATTRAEATKSPA
jgi:hypothetical protein